MAVVVQELVPAGAAGIMFTAHPLTGVRGQVLINAAWGLGEAIVGGQVSPDTIVVDKASKKVTERQIGRKDTMTVFAGPGTHEAPVPSDRRDRAVLGAAQAADLARLGMQVEELFGGPMDIEWALDHGRFFILQARAITALRGPDPAAGEWNDSLAGDYLWTRTNYGEAVPDVMTPCTWSLVQILLDHADPAVGPYRQYGNIGGRLYNNLSMAASLAAAFWIGPKRFAGMIADGFGRLPEGLKIPIVRLPRWGVLRMALPMAARTLFQMRANLKRLPVFLAEAPARCEALKRSIGAVPDPAELAALWQRDIAPFFLDCCHMVQASANQGGAAILTIPRNLRKLVGEDDANALLTGPVAGSGPLASLGPLLGLAQLANGEIDEATFARRFGHRGPHEAEISAPRPAEDPDWIDRQLAGLRTVKEDAAALLTRQETARAAAWERIRALDPRKETSIRRQIERWARIAGDREAARSEVIRALWVLRCFVLRAGALTGQGEGIFFLSIDEILALLGGDKASLASIPARRAANERYRALPPYPMLIRGRFDPFRWAAYSRVAQRPVRCPGQHRAGRRCDRRLPGCGRRRGGPGAGDQHLRGGRSVAARRDPGDNPDQRRVDAAVPSRGGRRDRRRRTVVTRRHRRAELGIPAVVGCGNATMRLKTGDRVRVDGAKGLVEIIERT